MKHQTRNLFFCTVQSYIQHTLSSDQSSRYSLYHNNAVVAVAIVVILLEALCLELGPPSVQLRQHQPGCHFVTHEHFVLEIERLLEIEGT